MSPEIALHFENPTSATERSTVLLVDPDSELLSYRASLLSRSRYTVVIANNYREVFELRGKTSFRLAVLSSGLGELALRAAAEFVRRQWPSARILILGSAKAVLEDSLYDEAVDFRFQPPEFLNVLERLCENDWTLRSRLFGSPPARCTHSENQSTSPRLAPPESDPRKMAHYKRGENEQDGPDRRQRTRQ